MGQLLAGIQSVSGAVKALVWGPATLGLLLFTGALLSLRCGFPQLRRFRETLGTTVGSLFRKRKTDSAAGNLTPFEAMTAALAGTVGTGNVAGVAGAVLAGGFGAVFWMWVTALLGMCTKYAEIVLAVRYRRSREGRFYGGPMYYIEEGLGPRFRWLALSFALLGALSGFGIGNLAQSSEIAGAAELLFGADRRLTGLLLTLGAGAVLWGGGKRVGRLTARLVPLMAGVYLLMGLTAAALRPWAVPGFFARVFHDAFTLRGVGGGAAGAVLLRAMEQGAARGVFSNEAGLGSAPMAHAAAETEDPCAQGLWGIFEVFADTMVICTLTAFALYASGVCDAPGAYPSAGAVAAAAFDRLLPGGLGGRTLAACLLLFAFSSVLTWSRYGERCVSYLARERPWAALVYRGVFLLLLFPGALGKGALLWDLADSLNGLMALPNLTALLLLSGQVGAMTKRYFSHNKKG